MVDDVLTVHAQIFVSRFLWMSSISRSNQFCCSTSHCLASALFSQSEDHSHKLAPLPLKVIIVLNDKDPPMHDTTNTCSCSCDCGVRARCPEYQLFHTNRDMNENNNENLSDCKWPILEPTRKRCATLPTLTELRRKVTTNSV